MCLCYARNDNEGTKFHPKKIKTVKDINDDETLVLNSVREVLQVNEKEIFLLNFEGYSIDILSTYNTKINPLSPRTRLYINYRKCFSSNGQCDMSNL